MATLGIVESFLLVSLVIMNHKTVNGHLNLNYLVFYHLISVNYILGLW